MKGGEFVQQDKEGRTITSIDGYRSYCIIVDRASRYTWVFLTKTKHPPVDLIKNSLSNMATSKSPDVLSAQMRAVNYGIVLCFETLSIIKGTT